MALTSTPTPTPTTASTTASTAASPALRWLHHSLVALWLCTAVVSLVGLHGPETASAKTCCDAGLTNEMTIQALVIAGALLDAAIGLAMWRWPGRRSAAWALGTMCLMTVVATVLTPSLWMHPLGPLTKNLPIAAALWLLMGSTPKRWNNHEPRIQPLSQPEVPAHRQQRAVGGHGLWLGVLFLRHPPQWAVAAQAVVARWVVRADTWFTTPAVLVQPASGVAMAHLAGWPLSTPWLATSLALYAVAGLCWLPVLVLQLRMAKMAEAALAGGPPLDALYQRYAQWWERLGYPAFAAMLVVFWLMVTKPALW